MSSNETPTPPPIGDESNLRSEDTREHQPVSRRDDQGRAARLIVGIAAFVLILVLIGGLPRLTAHARLERNAHTERAAHPTVSEVAVVATASATQLVLPGNIEAVDQTAVVARASGYVKQWLVDIGDHVTAGQTLAILATPDLDQQLDQSRSQLASAQSEYAQALANVTSLRAKVSEAGSSLSRSRAALAESQSDLVRTKVGIAHGQDAVARQAADLVQAQAKLNLAHVTADRYQAMLADGAVDKQTTDEAVASYQTNQANVQALQASLSAAKDDVQADEAAVGSAQSNVRAYESGVQSAQSDIDAAVANLQAGQEAVRAAADFVKSNDANVARMATLRSFQNVTAPYSGVITARNVDTGSLVTSAGAAAGSSSNVGSSIAGASGLGNAASGSGAGGTASAGSGGTSSLFSIAKLTMLRVYINVPQSDLDAVTVGKQANIEVSEYPTRTFPGTVARTSDSLDPVSRTLIAEVRVPNPGDLLRAGMFAQVMFSLPHDSGAVLIPDSALVTNALGSQVAVVTATHTIHFQPVRVGRDFGKQMEIRSGLRPGQMIVPTPSDGLVEGESVQVVAGSSGSGSHSE